MHDECQLFQNLDVPYFFPAVGTAIFSSLIIALTANIDWSASDMVGIVQWVG